MENTAKNKVKSGFYALEVKKWRKVMIGFSKSLDSRVRRYRWSFRHGKMESRFVSSMVGESEVEVRKLEYAGWSEERFRFWLQDYRKSHWILWGPSINGSYNELEEGHGNVEPEDFEWEPEIEQLKRFKRFWTHREIRQFLDDRLIYLENQRNHAF